MSLFEITSERILQDVMSSNDYAIVILDIYADWCGPCKFLTPKLEELAKSYPQILFCKLNSETKLKVPQGLPTIEFWVGKGVKQLYKTIVGADFEAIKKTIAELAGAPQAHSNSKSSHSQTIAGKASQRDKKYKTYGEF